MTQSDRPQNDYRHRLYEIRPTIARHAGRLYSSGFDDLTNGLSAGSLLIRPSQEWEGRSYFQQNPSQATQQQSANGS